MAGCRIVDQSVTQAIETVQSIKSSYETAGKSFIESLNNAILEMEGETKDALNTYINNAVNDFVTVQLAAALDGMANLLEANRENFETLDRQIAENISGS